MKKYIFALFIGLSIINCQLSTISAQTQPGTVRTVSRPNIPSEKLSGVMLRVRGNHNAVVSGEDGAFALLMQGLEAGQPYAISSVIKSGYELREPELIGRKQSFSTQVPLEIVMVSSQQLLQERMRIEEKARENVEINYQKRLAELDNALAAAKMSNAEYEAQITALEEQYERFEPLLQTMSRYYALMDYDGRDTLSARINERIEAGDLDAAEQLIKAKGAIADREKQLRELQELQNFLKKDLAEDCYNLFTINFERFQNDSAEYYICRRAELDTTNVEYQLRAGQFLMVYRAKYAEADKYFRRALHQAEAQNGRLYGDVATALNEIGQNYYLQRDYKKALPYLEKARDIREELNGKNSVSMAESYGNIGALYLKQGNTKEAMKMLRNALKLYEELLPEGDVKTAQARNNLGNVLFNQKEYDEAKQCFELALRDYKKRYGEKHYEVAIVYNNLASIAFVQGEIPEAQELFRKALNIFTQTLGAHHPRTQQTRKNLDYLDLMTNH